MIIKCEIFNYKSILSLEFEPGRVNVLIGENGCGKSNILESLAFAAAANSNKLDSEFLMSRGVRTPSAELIASKFSVDGDTEIKISLKFKDSKNDVLYSMKNVGDIYSKWESKIKNVDYEISKRNALVKLLTSLYSPDDHINDSTKTQYASLVIDEFQKAQNKFNEEVLEGKVQISDPSKAINNFVIFSPENTALKNYYKEGQIEPLSINGDGLIKLLKVISLKSKEQLSDIVKMLELLGWFKSLGVPKDLDKDNDGLLIEDKFTKTTFDQNSSNEGFLYILFYACLFVSEDSPKIFAIDNIETSLNPKLCTKLICEITKLAKKYNKQVFITTHNPATLDGIDLNDEEQKLFVVSRRINGQTKIKRIPSSEKPRKEDGSPMKLSDALMRGYLGGLPKGF
jgi:predicted ATPase